MVPLFWISAGLVAYVYFGYPLLLAGWGCVKQGVGSRLRVARANTTPDPFFSPPVSIVIAARNEAARIGARIDNLLAADYPAQRQIIVVSDGSTDGTGAIARQLGACVEVVDLPPGGKAAALNEGVARARHDILVFTDARQAFRLDALLWLTAPFADPGIGGVTGQLLLGCEPGGRRSGQDRREHGQRGLDRRSHFSSSIADGVGLYWRYEKAIRHLESVVGSTLGATGAIYALRRTLWRPLPRGTILDDVLAPMRAVLARKRIVFEPRAMAFDGTPPDSNAEAKRKVRTLAGNLQILAMEPRLLLPFANPVWIQYMSHKIGRLVVPYALVTLMASSLALAERHWLYGAAAAAQCGFYMLAGYGAWLEYRSAAHRSTAADIVGEEAVVDA